MKKKLIILAMALSLGLGMTSCGMFWDDMPPGGYGYYDQGPGPGDRFDAPRHGGDRGPGGGGHYDGGGYNGGRR